MSKVFIYDLSSVSGKELFIDKIKSDPNAPVAAPAARQLTSNSSGKPIAGIFGHQMKLEAKATAATAPTAAALSAGGQHADQEEDRSMLKTGGGGMGSASQQAETESDPTAARSAQVTLKSDENAANADEDSHTRKKSAQ